VHRTEETGREIGFDGPQHVMFNALPPFHIAGVGLTLLTLGRGGQSVCMAEFDPARLIAGHRAHRVTHMFLVPAMILALVNVPWGRAGRLFVAAVDLVRRLADQRKRAGGRNAGLRLRPSCSSTG
jgi:acyl-CoA synthetase (AMP-forming)/AMP-acid ligase II